MIYQNSVITINKGEAKIDTPIILYRGDREVEINFTLKDSPFKYRSDNAINIIEQTNADYAQLIIKVPNDRTPVFSEITETENGNVVFKITAEMIDEIEEVGFYDFQIRLFDSDKTSRATIPPVTGGIEIREPIAIEDEIVSTSNEVNVATANYAVTTTATPLDVFDEDGNYIETTWTDKMLITDARLNKIEDGITGVNQKADSIATMIPTKTSQLNNDSNYATETYVDNAIENIETTGGLTSTSASNITIADTANNFTAPNVEGALQEVGSQIKEIAKQIESGNIGMLTSLNGTQFILKVRDNGELYTEENVAFIPDEDLPSDFPRYTVRGQSVIKNDFLITPHNDSGTTSYIFIMDYKGRVKWYKQIPKFAYSFRKYKNKAGKDRYCYHNVINHEFPKFAMNGGYDNTKLVILDEKFELLKEVRCKAHGTIPDNYPLENHDYVFIDDNHYIVTSYHNNTVTNVPDVPSCNVVNCVIQEIKDDRVIFHWESIDHVELYQASHTNNNFAGFTSTTYNDYAHFNAIQVDDRDNNLLCSFRGIGLIKIDRMTGKILWIMGRGNIPENLKLKGFTPQQCGYLQHDARYNYDNSITIFDNSGCDTNNTRICRYWIDEETKTLTSFKEYKLPIDRTAFMGYAKLIDDQNEIFDVAGYGAKGSTLAFNEYNFKRNEEIMQLKFNSNDDTYRIFRDITDDEVIKATTKPCTNITLSTNILTFTDTTPQTLTVTLTPTDTTDTVVWSVSPSGICAVNNGVVTPVANGTCTITATCGSYSDTCAVTVSGMSESGGDTGVTYTDIDYIESTGTQYIDTGIIPTLTTKMELVADMSASIQYDHIFGSDNFMKLQWMNNTGTAVYINKKNVQGQITGLTLGKHTYFMDMSDTTYSITIDGTNHVNAMGATASTDYPLLLLSGYSTTGTVETEYCSIGKIYSCKIYDGDNLVRDMKPVLSSDGVYGLLDTVNNIFYGSEVDSFTGGNDDYSSYENSITLDGSLTYSILTFNNNPSGENGQVMVEYPLSDLNAIPSLHALPKYNFMNALNSESLKGTPNLYSVALWQNKVYLHFELDMATTGVENTVESVTSYLADNPMTFYYTV